ncbi:MAG TPA: hypothetical protein VH415_05340 [Nitrososphaeraceae archaeon]|jgi:hypothetical protein
MTKADIILEFGRLTNQSLSPICTTDPPDQLILFNFYGAGIMMGTKNHVKFDSQTASPKPFLFIYLALFDVIAVFVNKEILDWRALWKMLLPMFAHVCNKIIA